MLGDGTAGATSVPGIKMEYPFTEGIISQLQIWKQTTTLSSQDRAAFTTKALSYLLLPVTVIRIYYLIQSYVTFNGLVWWSVLGLNHQFNLGDSVCHKLYYGWRWYEKNQKTNGEHSDFWWQMPARSQSLSCFWLPQLLRTLFRLFFLLPYSIRLEYI